MWSTAYLLVLTLQVLYSGTRSGWLSSCHLGAERWWAWCWLGQGRCGWTPVAADRQLCCLCLSVQSNTLYLAAAVWSASFLGAPALPRCAGCTRSVRHGFKKKHNKIHSTVKSPIYTVKHKKYIKPSSQLHARMSQRLPSPKLEQWHVFTLWHQWLCLIMIEWKLI